MAVEKETNFFRSEAKCSQKVVADQNTCFSWMHKLTDSLGQIYLLLDSCSPFLGSINELPSGRIENKPVASRSARAVQSCSLYKWARWRSPKYSLYDFFVEETAR